MMRRVEGNWMYRSEHRCFAFLDLRVDLVGVYFSCLDWVWDRNRTDKDPDAMLVSKLEGFLNLWPSTSENVC